MQPENRQNVQKTRFLQKAPGVNGLKYCLDASKILMYMYGQLALLQLCKHPLPQLNPAILKYTPRWQGLKNLMVK